MPDAWRRFPSLEQLGRANVTIRPTGRERAPSLVEEPDADGEFTNAAVKPLDGSS
jgi:hypothetical protein